MVPKSMLFVTVPAAAANRSWTIGISPINYHFLSQTAAINSCKAPSSTILCLIRSFNDKWRSAASAKHCKSMSSSRARDTHALKPPSSTNLSFHCAFAAKFPNAVAARRLILISRTKNQKNNGTSNTIM